MIENWSEKNTDLASINGTVFYSFMQIWADVRVGGKG